MATCGIWILLYKLGEGTFGCDGSDCKAGELLGQPPTIPVSLAYLIVCDFGLHIRIQSVNNHLCQS